MLVKSASQTTSLYIPSLTYKERGRNGELVSCSGIAGLPVSQDQPSPFPTRRTVTN